VEILKNLIFNSSLVDETVLDPFMGTGSTGVACKELGRNFIGIELDATHFATAKARLGE
jgi:site-specific DNA-methyltransferase (adenine-specific)